MNAPKYAIWLFVAIIIAFFAICAAYADEVPKDCNYVPTQSDQVRYECEFTNANDVHKKLTGEGEVRVWICGKKYTIEIDCKPKDATK